MLEARDIVFGYSKKGKPLYNGFSLSVDQDERVALTAPSGAGKTTLARLLAGYEKPWAGEILCDGEPLPRAGVCPVQLVGQHPELAVDPRMRMERTLAEAGSVDADLLDALGIRREWLRRYPHELSGGELQRFCIARAIAARPRYFIADEISTMLDALTQAQLWEFILSWQARSHVGIVLVSHSPALLERVATRTVSVETAAALQ